MSQWRSTKARKVLAALLKIGWSVKRHSGTSHRVLQRVGWADYVYAFHDNDEIGPRMLARIAKRTGLSRKIYRGKWRGNEQRRSTASGPR